MATAFGLLLVQLVLFASDRLRMDLVSLLGVVALMLSGLLPPDEALAGFSDPLVLSIAGLFVVGGGLMRTGVADRMARLMGRAAGSAEAALTAAVMGGSALLSGFMSSTGTVAVLLPAVVSLARRSGLPPSRLLLPLAYGASLGGLLTLVGTPPNMVVSRQLGEAGLEPFGFFSFTPVGVLLLAAGIVYMAWVGKRLLPSRRGPSSGSRQPPLVDLAADYGLEPLSFRLRIPTGSPAASRSVGELELRRRFGATVLEATPETVLEPGLEIFVHGHPSDVLRMASELGLGLAPGSGRHEFPGGRIGLAEVLITPRSALLGQSLVDSLFRDRYGVTVLSIRRQGQGLAGREMSHAPLEFGDTLLVAGPRERLALMGSERRNFVVIAEGLGEEHNLRSRAGVAGTLVAGMLLAISLETIPMVAAILLAALGMVLSRCLTVEQAYRSMNWESLVLIAGMLPVATALEKTGGTAFLADRFSAMGTDLGAGAVLFLMLLITGVFSQFLSNTATAVLMAPVALKTALDLGLEPRILLMAVAVGASTAFATPMASPVSMLVLGPGGFRFLDFVRCGVPLQLLLLLLALLLLPVLF